jgi:amino acid transporter
MPDQGQNFVSSRTSPAGRAGASHLVRALSGFANFAMTFSGVGASAGLFTLFGLSLAASGGAFFWGWPLVCLGTLALCLIFAELASHYPFAGAMYHWPRRLLGHHAGWWVGWMYLFAAITLTTSTYLVVPIGLGALFNTTYTSGQSVLIALAALLIATVLNALGIRLLGRFTEYGVVVELTCMIAIALLVLIFGAHHSPAVLVHGAGTGLSGFLGGGILISLWVLFTFENAGTLGEETLSASRNAPRAILGALAATGVLGLIFLFSMLISAPSLTAAARSATPLQDIINAALPHPFTVIYLIVVTGVMILGANIAFTAAARQLFGMARDGGVPFSKALQQTRNGTPWVAVLVVAVITGLPFFFSSQFSVLITASTGFFYVTYVVVMLMVLIARLRGWPGGQRAAFSLKSWGLPVTLIALVWSAVMALDLLWPRDLTNPVFHGLRVSVWLIGVPFLIGLVYYAAVQRRRLSVAGELPGQVAPDEEMVEPRAAQ